ncbi:DUF58 domain-containing protein [Methylobacillus flagellatus]|uniref:DUF58 domain-containing protein n=1 Tax=Methylobacillus flagellatus (strain ATCC 51484 / DSM 6875 / VKM B-1610 / KT) TaxID=265072 RepID=Q1H082_METFK|nr:DUF58 domain-containing protein [Methylobacillus flagellatus]ABE50105.1 protein of unknown function DUF58 [Methylobacillus flagellatus KT]
MPLPSLDTQSARLWRRHSATLPAKLTLQRIYIMPSRAGWGLAILLLAMLTGAINYTLNLGFILTFLLAGMALVSLLHTWRNLAWLQVEAAPPSPVFAGQDAMLHVSLSEDRGCERFAIAASLGSQAALFVDVPANGTATLVIGSPTLKRGWHDMGILTLSTGFLGGLFRAWSRLETGTRCLVYPRPAATSLPLPQANGPTHSGSLSPQAGDEDFAGLRLYQRGDSPRRIDWKASSREQGMYSRDFHAESQQQVWLDLGQTPGSDLEQRLSQLTSWVMQAHETNQRYGLRLPGRDLAPAHSQAHYEACLRALALLEVE